MPCIACGSYHETDDACRAILRRVDYDWAHGLETGNEPWLRSAERKYDLAMAQRADREYRHVLDTGRKAQS
jgi:hypothetical protein